MRTASPSSTHPATASSKPFQSASPENALPGSSPEGLALSADGATLYVANAHSNAVAIVGWGPPRWGAVEHASQNATRN